MSKLQMPHPGRGRFQIYGMSTSHPIKHESNGGGPCPPEHTAQFGILSAEREPCALDTGDFRRIALSLQGAQEGSHMGAPDFRVGGRIFATLASQKQGYGNLMLTPEQQAEFTRELPEVFVPIAGGWGRMGMTHIRLAATNEDVLAGALRTAWRVRIEKNARTDKKKRASGVRGGVAKNRGNQR
jgi:hypothetical protein